MKKRAIAVCSAVLSVVLAMAGCGGPEGDADGKTHIRFATWDVAADVDKQQKLVDDFNKSQNKIEVSFEAYGRDFDTKVSAGMGSGDAPDVMYMWNYPSYHEGLEPLDTYLQKEGKAYKSRFYNTLWNYNTYGGKTYGVPVGFTTHALYFNKDIFAKAGLDIPDDSWTWDDLQQAAKTISEKTDAKGFSFQMKPDPYDFEMYLWSNGSAYCNKSGKMRGNLDSAKSTQVFDMFQKMEKNGSAIATEENGDDEFRSGKVAMYVMGSWPMKALDKDKVNYGVTTIPAFKKGQKAVSILSSSGISMSAKSKHKDAAWDFIKYWTDEKSTKARMDQELPVLTDVVESEKLMDKKNYTPFYQMLQQSTGHTPASFIMQDWSEVSENLQQSFEQIFNPSTLQDPAGVLKNSATKQG